MADIKGSYAVILNLADKRLPGSRKILREEIRKRPELKRAILDMTLTMLRAGNK